jgi:iron complex outermembrane receptor protein
LGSLLFLFFLLLTSLPAAAPQIQGTVNTPDGHPLPYTIILIQPGDSWVLSDEEGYFQLTADPGDSLVFRRYGYRTRVLAASQTRYVQVILQPAPVVFDSVAVTVRSLLPSPQTYPASFSNHIALNLQPIPALLYRNYGGPGGVLTVSLDGGLSRHTKILLDDMDLSSPQNGETDLSQIPAFILDHFTLSRSPALTYGSGAIDGSIQIKSSSNGSKVQLTQGSYGLQSQAGRVQLKKGTWSTLLSLGTTTADGNYPVHYQGQRLMRENNDFKQIFLGGKVKGLVGTHQFLNLQVLHTDQHRGIPGVIQSPNPKARRNDVLDLFQLKTGRILEKGILTAIFTQRNSDEHYSDPRISVNSRHKIEVRQFKTRWDWQTNPSVRLLTIVDVKQEFIRSSDVGHHHRTNLGLTGRAEFQPSPLQRVFLGLRLDRDPDHYREFTWQAQFVTPLNGKTRLKMVAGRGFKYPSFNDLYWNPGGNPDLKSESTLFQRLTLIFSPHENSTWDLEISRKDGRNLIQWIPNGSIWQPENVSRSLRRTVTIHTQGSNKREWILYEGFLTHFQTKDKSRQKSLLYVPDFTGNFLLTVVTGKTTLKCQISYVGRRIVSYDWPKDVSLPPYQLISAGLEFQPFSWEKRIKISLWIENLLDTPYQTIYGYPEPGRQGRISFIYQTQ